jgi:hypothetical protein
MTRLPRLVVALAASAGGLAGAQPAPPVAQSGLKPGFWEISTVVEFSSTSTRKTVTSRLCYSPADVAAVNRILPPQRGLGVQCLASDVKAGGTTGIAWKLTCSGKEGALNGSGTMKPGPTAYSAEVHLERKSGGKVVKIDEKTSGRWVGSCP